MAEATTEASANGRARKGGSRDEAIEKAKAAVHASIEEAWEQFETAIHETDGGEPASIGVTIRYKPGKETETKSTPARVEIVGRSSLPTNRQVYSARDSGGQLVLGIDVE